MFWLLRQILWLKLWWWRVGWCSADYLAEDRQRQLLCLVTVSNTASSSDLYSMLTFFIGAWGTVFFLSYWPANMNPSNNLITAHLSQRRIGSRYLKLRKNKINLPLKICRFNGFFGTPANCRGLVSLSIHVAVPYLRHSVRGRGNWRWILRQMIRHPTS